MMRYLNFSIHNTHLFRKEFSKGESGNTTASDVLVVPETDNVVQHIVQFYSIIFICTYYFLTNV